VAALELDLDLGVGFVYPVALGDEPVVSPDGEQDQDYEDDDG
jgi:hypothetical protein